MEFAGGPAQGMVMMETSELLAMLRTPLVVIATDGTVETINEPARTALGLTEEAEIHGDFLLASLVGPDGAPLSLDSLDQTESTLHVRLNVTTGPTTAQIHIHRLNDGRCGIELLLNEPHPVSHQDALTGLMDRNHMIRAIDRLIAETGSGAIILMDIDRLKIINDFLGYAVGDRVIQALGNAFRTQMPDDIELSRWSGHEFLALVPPAHCGNLDRLSKEFLSIANNLPLLDEVPLPGGSVTLSIGHTRFGPVCSDSEPEPGSAWSRTRSARNKSGRSPFGDPLGRVNAAVFEAKRQGRNRVVDADRLTRPSVYITGGALETALDEERIVAAVQPIIELMTGRVIADESLARLLTPDGDVIAAGEFIDAASALQIAHRIDHTIIRQTINYCVTSHFDTPRSHFVNISSDFLRHPDLVEDTITAAMNACSCTHPDMAAERQIKPLVIEVTEREILEDTQEALKALGPLIDFGLRLAIDDFGSGYSSYRYLLDLPIHFLKIEGDLVRRITTNSKARKIVQHIQAMASDMELTTVAEFVGDAETANMLNDMGIDWAQGFHFGRPELMHPELAERLRHNSDTTTIKA